MDWALVDTVAVVAVILEPLGMRIDSVENETSPCVGVCALDPGQGHCVGCLRTLKEIAQWSGMTAAARRALNDNLHHRRRLAEQADET